LNIRDDAQNTYLSIKFDNADNQIIFTDEITKFCLIDESIIQPITEDVCKKTFDIDKTVFKLVDDINYKVKILEYEGSSFICFHHINESIKYVTTIPLLENVNTSITYDDILKDKGSFG
jgi:Mg2+ and Co2+ transporter CorA